MTDTQMEHEDVLGQLKMHQFVAAYESFFENGFHSLDDMLEMRRDQM